MATARLLIRELEDEVGPSRNVRIEISSGQVTDSLTLQNPFDEEEEKEITWLLEIYPKAPLSVNRAKNASRKLDSYASKIISQVATTKAIQHLYSSGCSSRVLEIMVQPYIDINTKSLTVFHEIHWEALEDRESWEIADFPFERIQVSRQVPTSVPISVPTVSFPRSDFRILFVCARKSLDESTDVSFRAILQPVLEVVEKAKAQGRVAEAEILRPATFASLLQKLEDKPRGWFTEVHFDCHGEVSRNQANLLLSSESGGDMDHVPASLLAGALVDAGVLFVNLNACMTASAAARDLDSNLAITFAQVGVPVTIAMSHNVLDSASSRFEEEFYRSWLLPPRETPHRRSMFHRPSQSKSFRQSLSQETLSESVSRAAHAGRAALRSGGDRRGVGGLIVTLRDDIVPVVYLSSGNTESSTLLAGNSRLTPGPKDSLESGKWVGELRDAMKSPFIASARKTPDTTQPATVRPVVSAAPFPKDQLYYSSLQPAGFGFKAIDPAIEGRHASVNELEQLLSKPSHNVCVVQGIAGSGKSLFARHVCDWWKSTGFIREFFYIDCRKVSMPEGPHEGAPCNAARQDFIDQALLFMYKAIWPKKSTRAWYGKSLLLGKEQKDALWAELRSGRYLVVFDNADFPMRMEDNMLTITAVMTKGSGLLCRDSLMSAYAAMHALGSFVGEISKGSTKVIVTSRYRTWYDMSFDQNHLWFSLPQLSLSASLVIGQRKFESAGADRRKYEYAGSREDLAAIIDLLQYNPLTIETFFAAMIRDGLSPPDAYLKACTSGYILLEADASLAHAGGGRFVTQLGALVNIDWNDGADESRRPFSLFWVAGSLGDLPTSYSYLYWFQIIHMLHKKWDSTLKPFEMDLLADEQEICRMMNDPKSMATQLDKIMEGLNLKKHVGELSNLMQELGLVQAYDGESITDEEEGAAKPTYYRIHPLFIFIGRAASWGYDDKEHLENLNNWRRVVSGITILSVYRDKFIHKVIGGSAGIQSFQSGSMPLTTPETRAQAMGALQSSFKDLPTLIDALSWITEMPTTDPFWATLFGLIQATISLLACVAGIKHETNYAISEVFNGLFKKLSQYVLNEPQLLKVPEHANLVARLALYLASMSSNREGLPDAVTYLEKARGLAIKHRALLEPGNEKSPGFIITLREMDVFEANLRMMRGDRDTAFAMQRSILTSPIDDVVAPDFRKFCLIPALFQWLVQLKVRKEAFPTLHQLIQVKEPLENVIRTHGMWDEKEAGTFNEDVRQLMRSSVHALVSAGTQLPVPPRNKHFNSRFLQLYGAGAGEQLVTGLGSVHPTMAVTAEMETSLLKAFLLQADVAGSSGLAAVHMRAAQVLIGSGHWIEALRHLKAYASLPMPNEDRQSPPLRSQNSLLACLCFCKLACWEQARRHAFKAVQEAVEARDSGQSIIYACGALAGLECARVDAYTLTAKLLMLRATQTVYAPHQPGRTSGGPSEFQMNCRNGWRFRIMTTLGSMIPKYGGSYHPTFLPVMISQRMKERSERNERSFHRLEVAEATMDATILMLQLGINHKKNEAQGARMFWADKELEDALGMEIEQVAFGREEPRLKHFAGFVWEDMIDDIRDNVQTLGALLDAEDGVSFDVGFLRDLLEIPDDSLPFDVPESAIRKFKGKDAKKRRHSSGSVSSSDSSDEETYEPQDGYITWKIFCNDFTEHLLAKQMQKDVIPPEIWRELKTMFDDMEAKHGETK